MLKILYKEEFELMSNKPYDYCVLLTDNSRAVFAGEKELCFSVPKELSYCYSTVIIEYQWKMFKLIYKKYLEATGLINTVYCYYLLGRETNLILVKDCSKDSYHFSNIIEELLLELNTKG